MSLILCLIYDVFYLSYKSTGQSLQYKTLMWINVPVKLIYDFMHKSYTGIKGVFF